MKDVSPATIDRRSKVYDKLILKPYAEQLKFFLDLYNDFAGDNLTPDNTVVVVEPLFKRIKLRQRVSLVDSKQIAVLSLTYCKISHAGTEQYVDIALFENMLRKNRIKGVLTESNTGFVRRLINFVTKR
jgi:hypothetical protein